jgi:hypothetical protein
MDEHKTLLYDSMSGFASILLYCGFTFTSMMYFPDSWNPLTNTLSQLGNSTLNPHGSFFYALGMVLGGLALLIFYGSIYKRYVTYVRDNQLAIAIILGFVNAISVILSGATPENVHFTLHVMFSLLIFLTFPFIVYLVNRNLVAHMKIPNGISYYGYIVIFLTILLLGSIMITGVGGITIPLLESLSVFSFLGWVGLLSYKLLRTTA